jgi:hypothetical protein
MGDIDWAHVSLVIGAPLVCLLGVALTAVALPGTWLLVLFAAGVKLWQPEAISWWTFAALVLLGGLGELIEFFASAIGARKAGASRRGAIAAMVGSLVGAIVGLGFVPPIGPIVGGALGAAVGAIGVERWWQKREWKESVRAGTGAAMGRVFATVAKVLVAIVMGLWLSLAVAMS